MKAKQVSDAADAWADRLAAAGIKSPYGWAIYAGFFAAGVAVGAFFL